MQATRQEILDYLRRHGRGSVRDLGSLLALTSTGIRQHLTILERDGLIEAHEERGRVGRPALVYRLTDRGHGLYPKRYDLWAGTLLEEMRSMVGSKGMQTLFHRVAVRFSERYLGRMEGKDLRERVAEVVRIIGEEGSLVEMTSENEGFLIHRYTCSVPNIANIHSSACAIDTEFVRRLVRADAKLISCIARGNPECTYSIRASD